MYYNQFNDSYNTRDFGNNQKDESRECKKGICTVRVIQECCYPSYLNYEDNKNEFDNCNKESNYNYNCEKFDQKDGCRQEKCCCKKEDKWTDKSTCNCHKERENNCIRPNRFCGICSCFRRW